MGLDYKGLISIHGVFKLSELVIFSDCLSCDHSLPRSWSWLLSLVPGLRPLLAGPGGCWSSLATLGPALSPDPDQELGTTTCASDDQILGGGGLR